MKPILPTFTILVCSAVAAFAIPVTVTVVGPDNQPVVGAKLSVIEGDARVESQGMPRAIVGENGVFRFERAGDFYEKGAKTRDRARIYTYVRISAPGLTTETRSISTPQTTVHLQKGRVYGGLVVDAAEKPIAGVPVRLVRWSQSEAESENKSEEYRPILAFWEIGQGGDLRATTGADGRWQIDGLPARGSARIVLDDARFVKQSFDVAVGIADAPPLFVRAGATVTGVLLDPGGAPIADKVVGAGWQSPATARTDAAGRFTLSGLEPGEATLREDSGARIDDEKDYVVPPLEIANAVAGKTTDVGVWNAVEGVVLRAQLVDAATKNPVEGARISFWRGDGSAVSDAQGRIETRVLRADIEKADASIGDVRAEGYIERKLARPPLAPAAKIIEIGTLELQPGTVVKGTVRIEGVEDKTRRIPTNLRLNKGQTSELLNSWGGDENFTSPALEPGKYQLSVGVSFSGFSQKDKDWEIVSPTEITVAAPGVPAQPIEIVLRRLTPFEPLLGPVSGRITDENGAAIGGAIVSANQYSGNSYMRASGLSDADGRFVFQQLIPGRPITKIEITAIERPGYYWKGEPTFETANGATTIRNLTLKKRGATFRGRVVGADGKAASGAWVAPLQARDYAPVQTDAQGVFEMIDLPIDKFTLFAASGLEFAQMETGIKATDVELKLQAPPAFDREALAARAIEGRFSWWEAGSVAAVLGDERLLALAKLDDNGQDNNGQLEFLRQLAKRDAPAFLRVAPAFLTALEGDARAEFEALFYGIKAEKGGADDRIETNDWLDAQKAEKRALNADSVRRLLQLALVARQLEREDAASWIDYAAAIAAQLQGGDERWGAPAARLGMEAASAFVEGKKPTAEFAFWGSASIGFAGVGDLAGAKRALARMEELAKTAPELAATDAQQEWEKPATRIRQTREAVAVALAATDASAALELLPAQGNFLRGEQLIGIAQSALDANNNAAAERAIRQIFERESGNTADFALAASLAQEISPQLGAEFWPLALQRALPADDDFKIQPSIGMWAFYHARLDPARSRVLVEREWRWRLPAALADAAPERWYNKQVLRYLQLGMAAVDPVRALEMSAQARTQLGDADSNDGAPSSLLLGAAILATDAQRARLNATSRY